MCRVLAYLGEPVLLGHLLFESDNSLIRQAYDPKMSAMLNLAGFGLTAWDGASFDAAAPLSYRTTDVPVFDRNLESLSKKLRPNTLIAHVRGVPYHTGVTLGDQNLHPFLFDGTRLAMAHNGQLAQFDEMRFELLEHIRPELHQQIRGNTDSEWIYALLLSRLDDPAAEVTPDSIARAAEASFRILRKVRERVGIDLHSPVNLFVSDGEMIAAIRFAFDFGCYPTSETEISESTLQFMSLWYTCGRDYGLHDGEWRMVGGPSGAPSIILASEPLSRDRATWLEVPEYTMIAATRRDGIIHREEFSIDA